MPVLRHLIPVVLAVCIPSAVWSAGLCVQNGNSVRYQSNQSQLDCKLPDELRMQSGSTQAQTGQVAAQPGAARSPGTQTGWALRAEDGSVYAALRRWSAAAGWQISWEIPVDFPIEIEDASTGSYENAVRRVLTALRVSDYPPHPCFHENRVVRVVRRIEGNDDECR